MLSHARSPGREGINGNGSREPKAAILYYHVTELYRCPETIIRLELIVLRPHFRFSSFLPPPKVGVNYTYNYTIVITTFLLILLKPLEIITKIYIKFNLIIKFKIANTLKYIEENLNT